MQLQNFEEEISRYNYYILSSEEQGKYSALSAIQYRAEFQRASFFTYYPASLTLTSETGSITIRNVERISKLDFGEYTKYLVCYGDLINNKTETIGILCK